jgi:general secretion pathway protein F
MAKHQPRPFSRMAVNMVRAGEKGGVLEATLKRLAELLEESQEFKETLISALIYPILLTVAGLGAVVFLLAFVIPRFVDIFQDLGQSLPLVTQILLSVSTGFQAYWWLIGLGVLVAVLAVRVWLGTESGRSQWDRIALRLPVIGEVVLKSETARFARVLGTLLKSGVPVLTALGVVRELSGNTVVARAIERVSEGVRRGAGIAVPLREAQAFPPMAVHMVRVGEETGRLEDMLVKVASDFELEVRRLVKRLMGLLEPAIILVMGLLVGFIVVALLMAIFSLTEVAL